MTIDTLRGIFHEVAGALVWPVLISLLGLAAVMMLAVGSYLRDLLDRRRGRMPARSRDLQHLEAIAAIGGPDADLKIEEILQTASRERWQGIARLRLAVRVGPSLGLMGTLIPMANALQGLAEGNLPALARNMVTAFAATVIGLTISVIAYLIAAAREEWARADVQFLTFCAERLSRAGAADAE